MTQGIFLFALVCSVLSCDAGLPRGNNPNNCTLNAELCESQGLVCDPVSAQCVEATMQCTTTDCVPKVCSRSEDCTNPDNPICDTAADQCRPCQLDAECPSGLCRRADDYPEVAPIAGLKVGQCIPADQIAYVDGDNPGCVLAGTASSPSAPFCNISPLATSSNKPYIRIASSGTPYSAVIVTSGNLVFIGAGRDTALNLARFQVDGGTVTLRDLSINVMIANAAVTCRGNATVYLQRVRISNQSNGGRGVDADQDCARLYIDSSHVDAARFGIIIGTQTGNYNTAYRIVNTVVMNSGNNPAAELYGVVLGIKATGLFAFNTVTRNLAGISCASSQPISDSIITGNTQTMQVMGCTNTRIATNADLLSGPEPKLNGPTTQNVNCCINQGQQPNGPPLTTDYFGTTRPLGTALDRGYHELQ